MGWGPFRIIKGVIFVALASLIMGLFVMLLWNALVPMLFHGPIIDYWQAAGLFLLSRLLMGHVGGGCHKGGRHWRNKKWEYMGDPKKWGGAGNVPGKGQWSWTWSPEGEEKHGEA
jgi:hypothetical protein